MRTRARRRRILADLAMQSGWPRAYAHPDVAALVEMMLTPLLGEDHTLEEACDLRALEREAAALRLERVQSRQRRGRPLMKSISRKSWPASSPGG